MRACVCARGTCAHVVVSVEVNVYAHGRSIFVTLRENLCRRLGNKFSSDHKMKELLAKEDDELSQVFCNPLPPYAARDGGSLMHSNKTTELKQAPFALITHSM